MRGALLKVMRQEKGAEGAARGGRLRRVMSRVAMGAAVLLVVRLMLSGTGIYQSGRVGYLLRGVTFAVVGVTVVYYAWLALRWLKRKLLWRVRRRLVITYLFVGVTPLVLLTLLGFFSAMGGSSQALERIVVVQAQEAERQTLESARQLAREILELPANASEQSVQTWLDERAALLQAALPGTRIAVWRGTDAGEQSASLKRLERAQFVSVPSDEATRGVGGDTTAPDAPLPAWLDGRDVWSGLAFVPPVDARQPFGSPSLRAVVRERANGREVAMLLTVPVSRALLQRWHETTGLRVRPFFLSADSLNAAVEVGQNQNTERRLTAGSEARRAANEPTAASNTSGVVVDFGVDQFGEPMDLRPFVRQPYPVFLASTNWVDGTKSARWAFMLDWSWQTTRDQFLGDSTLGQRWRAALVYTGIAFLIFELLALLSAAWMTRAVTGAVHKLHRATGFIKHGDFSHRVRIDSHDQLGELGDAFNDMSANIESLLRERVEHERLQREVEIAHDVQAQLFPHAVPQLATAQLAGECRAARGVAGDYYDYIEVGGGRVALALGDVSGKGISAALVMSNMQAALRAQTTIIAERLKVAARGAAHAAAVTTTATTGGNSSAAAATSAPRLRSTRMRGARSKTWSRISTRNCARAPSRTVSRRYFSRSTTTTRARCATPTPDTTPPFSSARAATSNASQRAARWSARSTFRSSRKRKPRSPPAIRSSSSPTVSTKRATPMMKSMVKSVSSALSSNAVISRRTNSATLSLKRLINGRARRNATTTRRS